MLLSDKDTFHNLLLKTCESAPEYSAVAFVYLPIASSSIAPQQLSVSTNGPLMRGFSGFICIKIRIQMPWKP